MIYGKFVYKKRKINIFLETQTFVLCTLKTFAVYSAYLHSIYVATRIKFLLVTIIKILVLFFARSRVL